MLPLQGLITCPGSVQYPWPRAITHIALLGAVSALSVLAFTVGAFFSKIIQDALRITSPLIWSRVSSQDANPILVLI